MTGANYRSFGSHLQLWYFLPALIKKANIKTWRDAAPGVLSGPGMQVDHSTAAPTS
jgi:hypothetical protein